MYKSTSLRFVSRGRSDSRWGCCFMDEISERWHLKYHNSYERHRHRRAVSHATVRQRRRSSHGVPVCCIRTTRGCSCHTCITITITSDRRVHHHRTGRPWTRIRRIGRQVLPVRLPAACDRCQALRSCRCSRCRTGDAAAGNWFSLCIT